MGHQATLVVPPSFWVPYELPGGDEHVPGDSCPICHVFIVLDFWDGSVWGKRELQLWVKGWMLETFELCCDYKLI